MPVSILGAHPSPFPKSNEFFRRLKPPGCECNNLPHSSVDVKNGWSQTSTTCVWLHVVRGDIFNVSHKIRPFFSRATQIPSQDRQTDRHTAVTINNHPSFKLLHTHFYASQVLCWSPRVRVVSRSRVYNAMSCSLRVFNAHRDLHISTAVRMWRHSRLIPILCDDLWPSCTQIKLQYGNKSENFRTLQVQLN
jgi:hypothetical protein